MRTTQTPTTARALLDALARACPRVEGEELVFAAEVPAELERLLAVLHTGVRAVMAGRPWYGCGSARSCAAPRRLDPALLIPPGVTLLCAGGDACWDRIHSAAAIDHPELFERGRPIPS